MQTRKRADLPGLALRRLDNEDETPGKVSGTNELTSPRTLSGESKSSATVEMLKNAERSARHAAILHFAWLARGGKFNVIGERDLSVMWFVESRG